MVLTGGFDQRISMARKNKHDDNDDRSRRQFMASYMFFGLLIGWNTFRGYFLIKTIKLTKMSY